MRLIKQSHWSTNTFPSGSLGNASLEDVFETYVFFFFSDSKHVILEWLQVFNTYPLSCYHGTEEALEEYLDKFIKSILTKYLPKIDRTDFRLDKAIKDLETVIKICGQYDPHGILTYWIKTVKMDPESNPKLEALVTKLQKQYDSLKAAADKASPKTSNTTMSYRKEKMKEESTWDAAMEKQWVALVETMDEITEFLKNIQEGIKKLKQSRLVGAEEKSDEKA